MPEVGDDEPAGQVGGDRRPEGPVGAAEREHGHQHHHDAERLLDAAGVGPQPPEHPAARGQDDEHAGGGPERVGEPDDEPLPGQRLRGLHGQHRRQDRPRARHVQQPERRTERHAGAEPLAVAPRRALRGQARQQCLQARGQRRDRQREPEAEQGDDGDVAQQVARQAQRVDHVGQRERRERERAREPDGDPGRPPPAARGRARQRERQHRQHAWADGGAGAGEQGEKSGKEDVHEARGRGPQCG